MDLLLHSIPTWVELVSLAFCIGTLACRLWVLFPVTKDESTGRDKILGRLWLLFGLGIAAIMLCSVADLVGRAAEMSGSPLSAVFPLLPAVIMKTHFGKIWLIRMAGLALIIVFMMGAKKYREARTYQYILLFLAAIVAFTESATGHAADSGDFSAAEIVDLFHLGGSMIWAGGLSVLSLVVLPEMATANRTTQRTLADVAARFSRIAGLAVGAIVVTSLYNVWKYIGSVRALFESSYGQTVVAKLVFFALILLLAGYNRHFAVRQLYELAGQKRTNSGTLGRLVVSLAAPFVRNRRELIVSRFLRSVRIEVVLMMGLLLCVAMLRHEAPALHYSHYNRTSGGQTTQEHEMHGHDH